MSDNRLVTIVVPLCNAERYIRKCLKSVCSQSYEDIEILIVDDNSTDRSLSIVRHFAEIDNRIRLLDCPHQTGAQNARNIGIREARGSKLLFVDADDYLKTQAVERLSDAMDEYDVDIVQMRFMRCVRFLKFRYGETFEPTLCNRRIDGDEYLQISSYVGMNSYINPAVWAKIYRTHLLRMASHTPFDQFWGDDQIFNIDYLRLARSIAFIPYSGYVYRWGGRTSHFKFSALEDFKNVYRTKLKLGQDSTALQNEMLTLLRYYIRQLNTELGWTREAIVMLMENELSDPIWKHVKEEYDTTALVDCEFNRLQTHYFKYISKRLLR